VPNTVVQTLLGRLPAGATATGTTAVPLLDTDHRLFAGGRRNQLDLRVAKIVRFRQTRADLGVDIWNVFNSNYATTYQGTYAFDTTATGDENGGTWLNPTAIYAPRYARLSITFNF
jgi:hypothetical protein